MDDDISGAVSFLSSDGTPRYAFGRWNDGLTVVADSAPADWIAPRLSRWGPDGVTVGAVVPTGYPAYARILHPARASSAEMSWSEVAHRTGRIAHAGMVWEAISHPADRLGDVGGPMEGSLPPTLAHVLVEALRFHTTTPQTCWFAVWEGFGGMPNSDSPTVHHIARDYHLLRAPIEAVAKPLWIFEEIPEVVDDQTPNLWWPNDRAWCVATEIDFSWTYVGGPPALIRELLDHPEVEAYQVRSDDRAGRWSETVNPLPAR